MNARPQIAAILEQMAKIVAQPDTICTTERGVRALEDRASDVRVDPLHFAGMRVLAYPVGTVITERRTGTKHTI